MENPKQETFNPYQVSPTGLRPEAANSATPDANTMAIVSLVIGILSMAGFFFCGVTIILSPVAVVTGHMAMSTCKASPRSEGYGMALAGLITGYIGSLLLLIVIVAVVGVLVTGFPAQN